MIGNIWNTMSGLKNLYDTYKAPKQSIAPIKTMVGPSVTGNGYKTYDYPTLLGSSVSGGTGGSVLGASTYGGNTGTIAQNAGQKLNTLGPLSTLSTDTTKTATGTDTNALSLLEKILAASQKVSTPVYNEGPTEQEVNDLYQGTNAALDAQTAEINRRLPTALSGLDVQQADLIAPYEQKLQEGLQTATAQEKANVQEEQNAMAQARQLFNELSTYAQAKYGGMSSASEGALALLGRETAKQFGNITNTASANAQKVKDFKTNLDKTVFTAEQSIKKAITQKKQEVQDWFETQLASINTNRYMTEADKANKRYQALRDKQAFANNVETQASERINQLATWTQQQATNWAAQLAGVNTGGADISSLLNTFLSGKSGMTGAAGTGTTTGSTINNSTANLGGVTAGSRHRKNAAGLWEDTWDPAASPTLVNPETGQI